METPRHLVLRAVEQLFARRDSASAAQWAAPGYQENSVLCRGTGPDALAALVDGLPEDFRYTPHLCMADGGHVFIQATCHGLGPQPLTAYDLFRVEGGRLTAHWDALGPVGLLPPVHPSSPAHGNRALVLDFMHTVLLRGQSAATGAYLHPRARYYQHDVVHGTEVLARPGSPAPACTTFARHLKPHHVLARGSTVVARSQGLLHDIACDVFDLFTVARGRITEHRSLVAPHLPPSPCPSLTCAVSVRT
ncbi:nuclear transport factor 2 family protein [Streptomyces sp. NPDC001941]|uniref:nuclear transport factor 2 family protein n=1 Tax=Streptomyces sp. NPDC001941 TaxID=3154659 RepID=UPI00332E155D